MVFSSMRSTIVNAAENSGKYQILVLTRHKYQLSRQLVLKFNSFIQWVLFVVGITGLRIE
jgi:hypothetical protein